VRLRTAAVAQQSLAASERVALYREVQSVLSPRDEADTTTVEVGAAAVEFLEAGIAQAQHDPQSLRLLLEFAFIVFDGAQVCDAAKPLAVRTPQMEQDKKPAPVEGMMKKFIDAAASAVQSSQQPEVAQALALAVVEASRRNVVGNAGEYCFGVSLREGVVKMMTCAAENSLSTASAWGEAGTAIGEAGEKILGPATMQCVTDVQNAMQQGQEINVDPVRFCVTTLRKATLSSEAWSRAYGFVTLRLIASMIKGVSDWPVPGPTDERGRLVMKLRESAAVVLAKAPPTSCRRIVSWCAEAWAQDKAEPAHDAKERLEILVHLMNYAEAPSHEGGSPRCPLRAGLIRSDPSCLPGVVEVFMRGMRCCYAHVLYCPTDDSPGSYQDIYRALCSCFLNWPSSHRKEMEECLLRWGFDQHVLCSAVGGDIWACMLRMGTLQGEGDTMTPLVFQAPSQGLQVCRRPEAGALSRLVLHIERDLSAKARQHIARWILAQLTVTGDIEGAAAALAVMPFESFQPDIQGPIVRAIADSVAARLSTAAIEKAPLQAVAVAECARAVLRTSRSPPVELSQACRGMLLRSLQASAARRDHRVVTALLFLAGDCFAKYEPSAALDGVYIELSKWLCASLAQSPALGAAGAVYFLSQAPTQFKEQTSQDQALACWVDIMRFLASNEDWAVRHMLLRGTKAWLQNAKVTKQVMRQVMQPIQDQMRAFLGSVDSSPPERVLATLVADQESWQQLSRKRKRAEPEGGGSGLTASEEALYQNLAKRVKGIKNELAQITGTLETMSGPAPASKVASMQSSLARAGDALSGIGGASDAAV